MKTEEQELQKSVVIEGETPNCRSAREYREYQKEWIKGSCKKFDQDLTKAQFGTGDPNMKCKCGKPYLRHHEARYVVQHAGLL